MPKITHLFLAASALTALVAVTGREELSAAPQAASRPAAQAARPTGDQMSLVARGEYITNKASMCVQCHSGRDAHGEIIDSEKFRGGAIPFKSPYPGAQWADRAPNISGLPGFTDEQVIALLTTGQATDRQPPRRPMPPFRMTAEDARAVIAYLRSR